jgi:hypothetical protein
MKKILIHSPVTTDACSFYRGIGALAPLHTQYNLQLLPANINWSSVMGADLLYMQRPFSDTHLQVAKIAKKQMPIWVDYDDALLDVPASNPAFVTYKGEGIRKSIKQLLEIADLVTFSTPALRDMFLVEAEIKWHTVVPNAFNDYLFPDAAPTEPREKVVLWRGSDSHQGDLYTYKNEIEQLIHTNPDWKFVFMGMMPWMIEASYIYTSGRDIMEYFPAIRDEIKPSVVIAPLGDNPFNRAKSNIAWLESSYAGAVCAAPDFEEWQKPGVKTFTQETFVDRVSSLLNSSRLDQLVKESWNYICPDLYLSFVNEHRKDLIEDLT